MLAGVVVNFMWVPSHCGIAGNKAADRLAKNAARIFQEDLMKKLHLSEVKQLRNSSEKGRFCHSIIKEPLSKP